MGSVLQWARMTDTSGCGRWWRRLGVLVGSAPLLALLGCPQSDPLGPPPVQATAPTLTAPTTAQGRPVQKTPAVDLAAAPAEAPVQSIPQTAAHVARVQALINSAERAYASGVANYRAGRLDAARADFDASIDQILTSGIDVKADPQLADEMDHLLSAVNSLEMASLKQGNGFSAPVEAAPLDAADEVTFAPNAALTAKVQTELKTTQSDLPLVVNDYVTGFINFYSNSQKGHAHLLRSLERAGKYKDMIQKNLRDAGLPQDLIYLAVAESGFQPQALNAKSGAAGMWQFMGFQGAYGLVRNGYVDERFDPEKSSLAYARYMKTLYNQFGDWYLAMAAYDWGPGYVQRAVMKTGYADYWELYRRGVLPGETKNYVPGIIAAAIMAKNPEQYGLTNLHAMPAVIYDTVQTDAAVDLRLIADVTDVPVSEIVALNPSLLRSTTPQDMTFDLHIPTGTKDLFDARMKEIPSEHRASWRFHVVKPGETMDSIATTMHARVAEIDEANGLTTTEAVAAGDELVIPITPVVSLATARATHYRVLRGDTLITVADRFNVSVADLRQWNGLRASTMAPGRTLVVAEPMHLAPTGRARARASRGRSGARAARAGTRTSSSTARRSATSARGARVSVSAASARSKKSMTGSATKTSRH